MTEADSKAPEAHIFALLVALLRERLSAALDRTVQAQASISAEQIEMTIGALAGIDVDLADAAALHRSIVLVSQRSFSPVSPARTAISVSLGPVTGAA
jgi:hypothetical protein